MKEKFIYKLSEAKTEKEYYELGNMLNYSFSWLVRDIENLENKVAQNSFSSIEEAESKIKNIKERIADKMNKIEGRD